MNRSTDPYNLDEVIDACAKHAWAKDNGLRTEREFKPRGIETEAQLRQVIAQTVEDPETRAFRAHPQMEQKPKIDHDQAFGREIYEKRPYDEADKNYGITVVLNPERDEHGQIHGGSCYIRSGEEFERLVKQEKDAYGLKEDDPHPEVVIGGRPALREQEQHRQLVVQEQELKPEQINVAIEKPQQELQPERPAVRLYRALPGQSAEDHAREMQELVQKRLQQPELIIPTPVPTITR